MKVRWIALPLALAGALPMQNPALAQPRVEEDTKGALLAIPFDPPLGQELIYDVTRSREQDGKTVRNGRMRQSLRFERAGDAVVLTVTYLGIGTDSGYVDLTSEKGRQLVSPAQLALMWPVSFDLDESGGLLRVHDWAAWRQSIQTFMSGLVEQAPQAERTTMRQAMDVVLQPLMGLDETEAANAVLKGWSSFLGFGGVELEEGAEYEGQSEEPAAMLPVALPFVHRFSLSRAEAGNDLLFFQESEPDQAQTAKAVTDYMAKLATVLPDAQRTQLETSIAQLRTMKIHDVLEAQFDGATGILVEGSYERHVSVSVDGTDQQVVEATRIHRIP